MDNLDASICTHLLGSFSENVIENVDKINALKAKNPKLKTMYRIFSTSPEIDNFVSKVVAFIKDSKFDGLNIEYMSSSEKININLLEAFKKAFTPAGYILSVGISPDRAIIDRSMLPSNFIHVNVAHYDIPRMNQAVDYIMVYAFNWHKSAGKVDHHAPLYKRPGETEDRNIDSTILYLIQLGAAPSKLILAIPLFGKLWTLSSNRTDPTAPADTDLPLDMYYYEICDLVNR